MTSLGLSPTTEGISAVIRNEQLVSILVDEKLFKVEAHIIDKIKKDKKDTDVVTNITKKLQIIDAPHHLTKLVVPMHNDDY